MADENRNPVDQAIELLVYAPVGLALTARESLPDLIAKGRARVTSQVAMARMIGQFAVAEGEKEARRRVEDLTSTLAGLGLIPDAAPAPAPAPASAAPTTPAPAAASTPPSSSNGRAVTTPLASDHLAIPAYDTLSASQVVQRLPGLSADELEAVRAYESETRGRRTILSKVAQLQAGSGT